MSAILYLTVASIIAVISTEGAVIQIQDIPLSSGQVINIVIKEDPHNRERAVADLKIEMEDTKRLILPKLLNKLVKTAGDIPNLVDRISIRNGKCASGQKRKGPICV